MNEELIVERLKEDVLQRLGRTLDSPTDFDYLALQIKNVTGEDISSSTLKRLFKYIPSKSVTRRSSLGILARYVGFTGWGSYAENTRITSGFISSMVVMADKLHDGDKIMVEWKPDRNVTFVYLGQNKFVIAKSDNSHLQEGDTMEISMFVLNQPLQIKNVIRNGENIGHYSAGMDGGLTKLMLSQ